MKKLSLVTIGLVGILATGLYATNSMNFQKQNGMMQRNMQGNMQKKMMHKMMRQNHTERKRHEIMSIFRKLNLSAEQKQQLINIRQDMIKNRMKSSTAFRNGTFDKSKFIEIMKQKRDNVIELKAEMIDRSFKVLTPKQKEQFTVLVELKREKMMSHMAKRMNFDKNRNGGR